MKTATFELMGITLVACGSSACIVSGDVGTDTVTTATDATTTSSPTTSSFTGTANRDHACRVCLASRCAMELDTCASRRECGAVKECMLESGGDSHRIGDCGVPVNDWESDYATTIDSCAIARCSEACPDAKEYGAWCGINWLLAHPNHHDLEKEELCLSCLNGKCCATGLACGMSLDCWNAWSACAFNTGKCEETPGHEIYEAAAECRDTSCAEECL